MNLDNVNAQDQPINDATPEEGEEEMIVDTEASGDIEVEIEDADGGVAKMTLGVKDLAQNLSEDTSNGIR